MSYTKEECKQIKDFVRKYLDRYDLLKVDMTVDEQEDAILEMKFHPEFPVEHGKIASIIQIVFSDVRKGQ